MSQKNLLTKETIVELETMEEEERRNSLVQIFEDEKEFLKIYSKELIKIYSSKSGDDFIEIQFSNIKEHYPGKKRKIK